MQGLVTHDDEREEWALWLDVSGLAPEGKTALLLDPHPFTSLQQLEDYLDLMDNQ